MRPDLPPVTEAKNNLGQATSCPGPSSGQPHTPLTHSHLAHKKGPTYLIIPITGGMGAEAAGNLSGAEETLHPLLSAQQPYCLHPDPLGQAT